MGADRLVEDHAHLPAACVAKAFRSVPWHVDRDDLRGVAAVALVQAARSWDGRGDFAGYAFQRMVWAVQDHLRTLRRCALDVDLDDAVGGKPSRGAPPDEVAAVRWAWSRLPRQHREVLEYCVLRDLPLAGLAERWRVSESRVSQMKREALDRMRAEVA